MEEEEEEEALETRGNALAARFSRACCPLFTLLPIAVVSALPSVGAAEAAQLTRRVAQHPARRHKAADQSEVQYHCITL